jgi:hypothetical protein
VSTRFYVSSETAVTDSTAGYDLTTVTPPPVNGRHR